MNEAPWLTNGPHPEMMQQHQHQQQQQTQQHQQQHQQQQRANGGREAVGGAGGVAMVGAAAGSISRSQDDAAVGYFFQRPAGSDSDFQNLGTKRWAIGDESILEQGRTVSDLEREFHGLSVGHPEYQNTTKKLWEEQSKQMYSPWTARDDSSSWQMSEHAISEPIIVRRPGSFPGSDPQNMLSPRGSDALGVNMAEYVLGGSPTSKDMVAISGINTRLKYVGQGQGDGLGQIEKKSKSPSPFEVEKGQGETDNKELSLQNGLDDIRVSGSRQNTPTEEGSKSQQTHQLMQQQKADDVLAQQVLQQSQVGGLQIEAPPFEPVGLGLDPMQFDYNSHMVAPSMDSPGNFGMDYNQQMMRQQAVQQQQQQLQPHQQQQVAVLAPQFQMGQQQQIGLAPATFAPAPYLINSQDPYSVGIPLATAAGPAVVPQYIQTPWGLYPANIIQQLPPHQGQGQVQGQMMPPPQGQGQQALPAARGQQRPATPNLNQQQQQEGVGTGVGPGSQGQGMANIQPLQAIQQPQYQILTTPAYYDQNGQLVMGNPRGVGTPVRLVSPAPILVNATGQQGYSTSLGYNQPPNSSIFSPVTNTLGLAPQQPGFNNSSLGGLGNPANPGAIGSGLNNSGRRDSLGSLYDKRQMTSISPFYGGGGINNMTGSPAGPMGLVQAAPQSLTPPGAGMSLAPGAEAKYRNGSLTPGGSGGLFGTSSLFPSQPVGRRTDVSGISRESTGRSRLLEDFRNNRIPNLQLKDLVNHVVEFSQDQHGSRFIQQKLERATPSEKAMVFGEILTAAYSLMTDVFGNYVIQKFFEFGSNDQKQTLAQRVRGHVLPLALQMYGCRVIQKALESIPSEMQVEIVKELDSHVLKCVKDQNGNHVVQKCIECVDPSNLQFLIDAFKGQVFNLSTHPYGCRVIQRILEHCLVEQTNPILEEIHSQIERLVQDQYGNYVIQHVLEHGRMDDKSRIVAEIRGKVLILAQHKFASNVVEKCVSHSSRAERAMLIDEVITMNDGPHSALYTMMKDQFANYVVQKMIDVAESNQRKILMHKIRPHVATLRKYTYGKHILVKLEKFFMKNNADLGPIGMPPSGSI